MKKNKIMYLFLFILLSFSFTSNVYAAGYEFKINSKSDESKDFFNQICGRIGVNVQNKCKVICNDNTESNFADGCGSDLENYKSFYPMDYAGINVITDITELKKFLNNSSTCPNNKKCFDYVKNTYCKNNSSNVCKELLEDTGNPIGDSDPNHSKTCYTTIKIPEKDENGNFENTKVHEFTFSYTYYPSDGTLQTSHPYNTDDDININFTANGKIEGYSNVFYPYSVSTQNLSNFAKTFGPNIIDNQQCPKITFCCDAKIEGKQYWYAEVGTSCPSGTYLGSCSQTVDEDGVSGNINFSTSETNYGSNLLGGEIEEILDCETLFGGSNSELISILRMAFNILKIIIPIILLVLGSLDFAKAIFAQDEANIKKSQSKFIRRIIIAIVIFLIPSILKVILTIAHNAWGDMISPDFCGIL